LYQHGSGANISDFSSATFALMESAHMRNKTESTEASQQYAAAYAAHYTARDLPLALQRYKQLMASHPSTREAAYARMQVQNIVNAVIPKQALLDAQIELLLVHFEHDGLLAAGQIPARQFSEGHDQAHRQDG
jgi:hypothetical protein